MSNPSLDDAPEIGVYVSTSISDQGVPRINVRGQVLDIHFGGRYGPYLSMAIDDWQKLSEHVNAVIASQLNAESMNA